MSKSKPKRWSNLGDRVKVAAVLAVVSLTLISAGLWPFFLQAAFLAIAGISEFFDMCERKNLRPARRLGTALTVALLVASCCLGNGALFGVYCASFVLLMVVMVMRASRRQSMLLDAAVTWAGVSYLGLFSFLLLIRRIPGPFQGSSMDKGAAYLLLVVCLCAVTDIGAYFVGRTLGRTPLYPSVSPNKTWEGSSGGVFFAALLMAWVARGQGLPVIPAIFLGIVVSVCGQVGDLWESALKREVGIKDSGDLLRAHGGVLDRFDSLAFAAPVFYLSCQFLGWI